MLAVADRDPTRRSPGQYARATVRRLRMRTLVALGVLATATALLGRGFGLHDWRFIASELALLVSMLWVSRYVVPLVERRDRGALAEEHVGGLLDELPTDRWRVIHDASLGRGNVDHIAIGPPGLFTVETKSHPGPIRVTRMHGATVAQAQAQARAIGWVTGLQAQPLIVFSRAWVDRPGARRKGVCVLPARMLVGNLTRRPTVLTGEEVQRAHELLVQALTQHRQQSRQRLGGRLGLLRQ